MKKQNIFLGILAIIIIAVVLFWIQINGVDESTPSPAGGNEVGNIVRFIPDVTVFNTEIDSIIEVDQSVFNGDTLFTNTNGFAMLLFKDESITKITPNSELVISSELNGDRTTNLNTVIELTNGALFFDIQPQQNREFQVVTSRTVASVKGTRFGINSDNLIWMEEGEVEATVRETGESFTISDSMYFEVDEEGQVESGTLSVEELEELTGSFSILDDEVIEQQLRLRFRDSTGNTVEEDLQYYEQEENDNN